MSANQAKKKAFPVTRPGKQLKAFLLSFFFLLAVLLRRTVISKEKDNNAREVFSAENKFYRAAPKLRFFFFMSCTVVRSIPIPEDSVPTG